MALLCIVVVIFLALALTAAWAIALRTEQSGFIDATWSFAIGIAALIAVLWPLDVADFAPRRWLIAGFVAIWSARLGLYIFNRSLKHGDDARYAALKAEWGDQATFQLFLFLQIQALAGWPLAAAAGLAAHAPFPYWRLQDLLAVAVFLIALSGEAIADRQMAVYRADPHHKGGICDIGLWSWSRHPNYFFEWLVWVAYALVAIDFTGAYPLGWLSLVAPAVMYWLLAHVSGVPPLEAHLERSRPAAFAAYKARVSAFWPLPPRGAVNSQARL